MKVKVGAICAGHGNLDILLRHQRIKPADGEAAIARQAQRLAALAIAELQGQHAHADQVRTVDALEAFHDHRRTPSSTVPLAAQSRLEPVPYSLPPITTSGVPSALCCIAAS